MGRKKKETKKDVELRFRIEPEFKKRYIEYCQKYGYVLSKQLRDFIIRELTKE